MYTVTFYSFKGGVGRTMSLVNVATQLALAGKKVLIVDFDLEAPGIPTFALTAPKKESPGLVEYIEKYKSTCEAPNAVEYIYSAHEFDSGGEILVMPAGIHNFNYSSRLNSIDWQKLYSEEDGYLFFEDLKRQWQKSIVPDYVLIDSRTGHSDVEGICTRQLPDAVCLLFSPNDQNLQGLKRVVANIRSQNEARNTARLDPIFLHFVVSNVPDLDDEDGIIDSTLERFGNELGYEKLSGQIHHYNSLSLLNQEIFSEKRPKSRLAREYRELTNEITRQNISDRDAAYDILRREVRDLRTGNTRGVNSTGLNTVERILGLFPSDSGIVLEVALIYETIGRVSDALTLLSGDGLSKSAHYYAIRARLNQRLGNEQGAKLDLHQMLSKGDAKAPSLLEAMSVATRLEPILFDSLPNSPALMSLSEDDRLFVASQLGDSLNALNAKATIYESLRSTNLDSDLYSQELALIWIGLGQFGRAVDLLDNQLSKSGWEDIGLTFNLAMAKLGLGEEVNTELFSRVVELDASLPKSKTRINYITCIAIANAAVGRRDNAITLIEQSREMMKVRPRREFSPWSYTTVSSREYIEHLDALLKQVKAGELHPAFCQSRQET
jgi:MinD-like ATPase involved in chromosome partitioning or flagellar assembly